MLRRSSIPLSHRSPTPLSSGRQTHVRATTTPKMRSRQKAPSQWREEKPQADTCLRLGIRMATHDRINRNVASCLA